MNRAESPQRAGGALFRSLAAGSLCVVVSGIVSITLLAHGDLHAQIAALTKRIQREPANPSLYVERGGLHRAHREWRLALADCDHARRLAPTSPNPRLCRGLTLADAGRHLTAERELGALLDRHPDLVAARVARARVPVLLHRPADADREYAAALAIRPNPDWYLERARAMHGAGDARAIGILDDAIETLGPLVTLEEYAIDLDLESRRHESALKRVDRVLIQLSRPPAWLVRRGVVLEMSGRSADARQAYTDAVVAIESMPSARRATRAMEDVLARARAGVSRNTTPLLSDGFDRR